MIREADILSWGTASSLVMGFAFVSICLMLGLSPGGPQFDQSYVIRLQQTQSIQLDRIVDVHVREMSMQQIGKELHWSFP